MSAPKRALVTGAGTRVGRAIAIALGRRGAQVAVHYHTNRAGADETAAEIRSAGGGAHLIQADLYNAESCRRLAAESIEALGGLDLLVPSAANFDRVSLDEVDDAAWQRALDLNLRAPFLLSQAARQSLSESCGSITFITCASTAVPFRNYLPYTVSKAGLRHLMRTLSLELAPHVRVNAVAPGTVLPPPEMEASAVEALASRVPLQRIGEAEDIARSVLFLMDSPFITGQELMVDGGRSVAAVERFT